MHNHFSGHRKHKTEYMHKRNSLQEEKAVAIKAQLCISDSTPSQFRGRVVSMTHWRYEAFRNIVLKQYMRDMS